jgi:hypothetical protein
LLSFGLASFLASRFLLRRFVILLHPAIVSLNCEIIGETRYLSKFVKHFSIRSLLMFT